MLKPKISMVASLLRGVVISGVMIVLLPLLFGANSVWYAMLITEILVALFNAYCIKKLN